MNKTVLILEDEPDIRELLAIALEGTDMHCELTGHLSEAKSLLTSVQPDFVITDIHLPDGNGLDMIKFVSERAPGTPCAVITAYGDMDSAVTAMRAGAVDYFTKPIDMRALKGVLKTRLSTPKTAVPPVAPTHPALPVPAEAHTLANPESRDRVRLLEALEATRWNKRAAAVQMGLSYRQFRYRLTKHGIQ